MMAGSLMAGMEFGFSDIAGVEALGGVYDMPHGVANSIFLPVFLNTILKQMWGAIEM